MCKCDRNQISKTAIANSSLQNNAIAINLISTNCDRKFISQKQSDRTQSNIKTAIANSSPHHKAIAPTAKRQKEWESTISRGMGNEPDRICKASSFAESRVNLPVITARPPVIPFP